jgi:hypothetical protein
VGLGGVRRRRRQDVPPGERAAPYFIDRDGHPVLTADGRPVHLLVDEHGDEVRDAQGRSIGPVEIPPGCRVKARHERDY